jgi:hypothetical protein
MKVKTVSKYRYDRDLDFSEYMQEAWPEHTRRIVEARRAAPFVRFYYPLIGFLFSGVIAGGLSLIVTVISKQESLWKVGEGARNEWMYGVVQTAVPIMWIVAAVVVLIVVMACVSAGIAKARALIFDAEKLEMSSRMEYYFGEKLAAAAAPESNAATHHFGDGVYPVSEISPE